MTLLNSRISCYQILNFAFRRKQHVQRKFTSNNERSNVYHTATPTALQDHSLQLRSRGRYELGFHWFSCAQWSFHWQRHVRGSFKLRVLLWRPLRHYCARWWLNHFKSIRKHSIFFGSWRLCGPPSGILEVGPFTESFMILVLNFLQLELETETVGNETFVSVRGYNWPASLCRFQAFFSLQSVHILYRSGHWYCQSM